MCLVDLTKALGPWALVDLTKALGPWALVSSTKHTHSVSTVVIAWHTYFIISAELYISKSKPTITKSESFITKFSFYNRNKRHNFGCLCVCDAAPGAWTSKRASLSLGTSPRQRSDGPWSPDNDRSQGNTRQCFVYGKQRSNTPQPCYN